MARHCGLRSAIYKALIINNILRLRLVVRNDDLHLTHQY